MKNLIEMRLQQEQYIKECEFKVKRFINSHSLDDLEVILLSGSVARGDFNPGKFGGMIDLTIIKRDGVTTTATELFGEDEEPDIPYHCIRYLGQWFSIYFNDFDFIHRFEELEEARKFAILESKVLFDREGIYQNSLNIITKELNNRLKVERDRGRGYINYLLSEYKTDRWRQREAYPQLHMNLNRAIDVAIKCLFYSNNQYAPAEDRRLYYSYSLNTVNSDYPRVLNELFKMDLNSYSDYKRREEIFFKYLLPMV